MSRILRHLAPLTALLLPLPLLAAPVAEIVSLSGHGDWRPAGEAPWQPANLRQPLDNGNAVRTGSLSAMALLFADQTQIKLGSGSEFQIDQVAGREGTVVDLIRGRSWSQTKNAPSGGVHFRTPSGNAAIQGTEWLLEVALDGRTTLTVVEGVVAFENPYGRVTAGPAEEVTAAVGEAPVKRRLINPRARVQWVATWRFPSERYPELAEPAWSALASQIAQGELAAVRTQLGTDPRPLAPLLLAELDLAEGESTAARQRLATLPPSGRVAALQAEALLREDNLDRARQTLAAAPSQLEVALVRGELERLAGHGEAAAAAYAEATALAPADPRAWWGRGRVAAEQEHYQPAAEWLQRAIALAPERRLAEGDLALLETLADQLEAAKGRYQQVLERDPADYVALTGLGLAELKSGHPEAALTPLLAATAVAPEYARAPLYIGVAYYQLGREADALASLQRAARLDPHDPLPWFYIALIRQDQIDPAGAITAARAANDRLPYLKSLNQLANDRQGSANLGAGYAQFGLEEWALREAHRSQLPFWAGSHLFLADRLPEGHAQRSALMQGLLTDPTVFGASPLRHPLIPAPNAALTLKLRASEQEAMHSREGQATASGYSVAPFPLAGFIELHQLAVTPAEAPFDARVPSAIVAAGARPTPQLGLFAYADRSEPQVYRIPLGSDEATLEGRQQRIDLGGSWRHTPSAQSWLQLGQGEEQSIDRRPQRQQRRKVRQDEEELALRHTRRSGTTEWSVGVEAARLQFPQITDRLDSNEYASLLYHHVRDVELNTSRSWLGARWEPDRHWLLEGTLEYAGVAADLDLTTVSTPLDGNPPLTYYPQSWTTERDRWYPRLGLALSPNPRHTYRIAYQHWLRPVGAAGLAPITTAGIPLTAPGLLRGGELRRLRLQGEWELNDRLLLTAFADRQRISNLHDGQDDPFDYADSAAQYQQLRQQSATHFGSLEALEWQPIFASGEIESVGLLGNAILLPRLSLALGYIQSAEENRRVAEYHLPYIPRHRATTGLTWLPASGWTLQSRLSWRSERASSQKLAEPDLAADFDLALRAAWESADKSWLLEGFAGGLLRKDDGWLVGGQLVRRF